MKYSNKLTYFIGIVTILLFIIGILFVNKENIINKTNELEEFLSSINEDDIVNKITINNEIVSILLNEDDKLKTYIFDNKNGKRLTIKEIIDNIDIFNEREKELLYLKYPSFIANILISSNKEYFFKDNELIIYYYDYEINPNIEGQLLLTINYNEIKDILKIKVMLDEEYMNEDGFSISEDDKLIAITFDDGPSQYTKELSKILVDNKAHSTFFFVGKLLNNEDAVLKVFNDQHEIGYHSYAHKSFTKQTESEIKNDFIKSNEKLNSLINKSFQLTRPPYGSINSSVKNALDQIFILWNVDTNDWRYKDVDYLVNYVLENVNDGDIILFHDTHKTSIEAIKILLPELYVRGYKVVTVSELAKQKNKTLNNHTAYYSIK